MLTGETPTALERSTGKQLRELVGVGDGKGAWTCLQASNFFYNFWNSSKHKNIILSKKKKKKKKKPSEQQLKSVKTKLASVHEILIQELIVLGFNDTSTLEGHFVSSPREREKRDRRESRGDEREGQGRKRNRNESEETEEIHVKTFPLYPYPLQG